jgi:hypothetical protein
MMEKQTEQFAIKREEETKKMKIDTKHKIIEDMQNRISQYKSELFKNRIRKDDI